MYLIETKAILFAAFSALSHLIFLADQGFIQDFWRGGGGGGGNLLVHQRSTET